MLSLFERNHMKRSVKTIIKEAACLLWQDIKNMKIAILVIALYLWINRTFFPVSCIWVAITGFPCPGCGLTRAGMALLKGNFKEAFQIHPFIYIIVAMALVFCIYRYILKRSQKVFVKYALVVVIAMLCFYVYRMVFVFPDKPPMSYYHHNLMSTFFDKV